MEYKRGDRQSIPPLSLSACDPGQLSLLICDMGVDTSVQHGNPPPSSSTGAVTRGLAGPGTVGASAGPREGAWRCRRTREMEREGSATLASQGRRCENTAPRSFDAPPVERWGSRPLPLMLASMAEGDGVDSPPRTASSCFLPLGCSLLEPSRHAARKPRGPEDRPAWKARLCVCVCVCVSSSEKGIQPQ